MGAVDILTGKKIGIGMKLEELADLIDTVMSGTDAQSRYRARQVPVKCRIFTQRGRITCVITGVEVEKQELILEIEPEFEEN